MGHEASPKLNNQKNEKAVGNILAVAHALRSRKVFRAMILLDTQVLHRG